MAVSVLVEEKMKSVFWGVVQEKSHSCGQFGRDWLVILILLRYFIGECIIILSSPSTLPFSTM